MPDTCKTVLSELVVWLALKRRGVRLVVSCFESLNTLQDDSMCEILRACCRWNHKIIVVLFCRLAEPAGTTKSSCISQASFAPFGLSSRKITEQGHLKRPRIHLSSSILVIEWPAMAETFRWWMNDEWWLIVVEDGCWMLLIFLVVESLVAVTFAAKKSSRSTDRTTHSRMSGSKHQH